jgi:DNA-directed RNA polymerase sigma subunit (sigma70/sigma32)
MAKQLTYRSNSIAEDAGSVVEHESDTLPVLSNGYDGASDDAESDDKEASQLYDNASDPSVARYFADVQQYPLLKREEEQALWQCIDQAHERSRRALYMAPSTLAALTHLWQQVENQTLPMDQFVDVESDENNDTESQRAEIIIAFKRLQALETQRHKLRRQSRRYTGAKRRTVREQQVALWREWLQICGSLPLHMHVYQTLSEALEQALRTYPDDTALRAVQCAWKRSQQQFRQSKAQMLQSNLRLVIHVANRYRGRGVAFPDLIQEGNIGLMRALEKFEASRGLKFNPGQQLRLAAVAAAGAAGGGSGGAFRHQVPQWPQ